METDNKIKEDKLMQKFKSFIWFYRIVSGIILFGGVMYFSYIVTKSRLIFPIQTLRELLGAGVCFIWIFSIFLCLGILFWWIVNCWTED